MLDIVGSSKVFLKNSQIQAKVHKDITIAWKIRRIDGNGSVFALLKSTEKLVDHMVFPIYIRARRSLHTLLVIQPPIIWINEKALKIFSTEAHNKVKNKIGQKYQGHSSGKSFAKELQEENKDRKQARRYPTVAAATATVAVASFEGICHGTAKPWKMPAFSRNFWVGPTPKCNAALAAMFWPWKNVHTQTPRNLLQIILDKYDLWQTEQSQARTDGNLTAHSWGSICYEVASSVPIVKDGCKKLFFCHAHWDKAIQQPWANSSNEFVLLNTSEYFLELLPTQPTHFTFACQAQEPPKEVLLQALEATSLGLFLNPYETPKVESSTSHLISLASILQIAHLRWPISSQRFCCIIRGSVDLWYLEMSMGSMSLYPEVEAVRSVHGSGRTGRKLSRPWGPITWIKCLPMQFFAAKCLLISGDWMCFDEAFHRVAQMKNKLYRIQPLWHQKATAIWPSAAEHGYSINNKGDYMEDLPMTYQ